MNIPIPLILPPLSPPTSTPCNSSTQQLHNSTTITRLACFLFHEQISYTPSSDYLSNRQLFPSLWRTYPPEANISSPIIAILKRYNWTKMKILTQEEDLFLTVCYDIIVLN